MGGRQPGDLSHVSVDWHDDACVGVVLAAAGYPGTVRQGDEITGLDDVDPDILVFHAGTAREPIRTGWSRPVGVC